MLLLNVIWSDGTEVETYWRASEVPLESVKLSFNRGGHTIAALEIIGYYPNL